MVEISLTAMTLLAKDFAPVPPLISRENGLLPQFLICGPEHCGTTLVSDVFRRVGGLDSGFECGVLLCETPADFAGAEPFARNMLDGWGISAAELADACQAPDFAGFYGRLVAQARRIDPATRMIFDKTPRYLSDLSAVLGRHSAPVLICFRDPRGLVWSDYLRACFVAGGGLDFDHWYEGYAGAKIAYLRRSYDQFLRLSPDPRVQAIGLEDLCSRPRPVLEAAFAHTGQAFDLAYLVLPPPRVGQVRGRSVSAEHALTHLLDMPRTAAARVIRDFGEFGGWFHD